MKLKNRREHDRSIKQSEETKITTKEKIIHAANEVFAERGKHGARMDQIAAKAKVNKAMVYYYFGNKDNLFQEVLSGIFIIVFAKIIGSVAKPGHAGEDPVEQLKKVVRATFEAVSQSPNLARIVLYAIANEEQDIKHAMESIKKNHPHLYPTQLFAFLEKGIAQGKFRNVDPRQTIVSIVGMNIFYFVWKPIARMILGLETPEEEQAFLKAREEGVLDLLLHGILERRA